MKGTADCYTEEEVLTRIFLALALIWMCEATGYLRNTTVSRVSLVGLTTGGIIEKCVGEENP